MPAARQFHVWAHQIWKALLLVAGPVSDSRLCCAEENHVMYEKPQWNNPEMHAVHSFWVIQTQAIPRRMDQECTNNGGGRELTSYRLAAQTNIPPWVVLILMDL